MSTKNDAHKRLDGRTEIWNAAVGAQMTDKQTDRQLIQSELANEVAAPTLAHLHGMADAEMDALQRK